MEARILDRYPGIGPGAVLQAITSRL